MGRVWGLEPALSAWKGAMGRILGVARWVGAAHLVVGYAVLGQIVARKKADGS